MINSGSDAVIDIILNAILLALPVLGLLYAYVLMCIEFERLREPNSGDPIVYETELVGISSGGLPLLVYFLLPNALMLTYLLMRTRFAARQSPS